jgi:aspartyl-tRNA(Asn)/glutamyl-tRNA(Gln) amidotransferase subunit C
MSIDSKDIDTIAHLARLELSEAGKQEALNSINNILALINQMQAIDTSGVQPLAHAFDASQRLREDVVTEPNQRDILLALAPSAADGLFLVPKVIE